MAFMPGFLIYSDRMTHRAADNRTDVDDETLGSAPQLPGLASSRPPRTNDANGAAETISTRSDISCCSCSTPLKEVYVRLAVAARVISRPRRRCRNMAPGGKSDMRILNVAVLLTAVVLPRCCGVAAAAPVNYCAELKGTDTGQVCQIQASDPGYNLDISFPNGYPDQKSLADYVTQTREQFVNLAKSPAPRDKPYELNITSTSYGSAVPPRGTQAVVLKTYQSVDPTHPEISFKAFNWDQGYRKPITYEKLWRPDTEPLNVVFPIVQSELQQQTGEQVPIAPSAGLDPANYQNFAVTNDGVIFFFNPGELLPEPLGATQVLVPRAAIEPMLA
jgi:hypothetical protein